MGKYSNSPDWADVKPIPLNEPVPHPLASIAYSGDYDEAMSYLRAVLAADDTSARVLGLTADIIKMNPSHYTVWIHRAKTLQAQRVPYKTELKFLEPLSLKYLKNYQIWQHRQTIAGTLTSDADPLSYEHEAAFMAKMLDRDAKNYHVWVYRHWLVEKLDLYGDERELAAVDELLEEDVRNNSAWSHRWLLVFGVPPGKEQDAADIAAGAPGWPGDDGESDDDDDDDWVDEPDEAGEAGEAADKAVGKDAEKDGEKAVAPADEAGERATDKASETKPQPADAPRAEPAAPKPSAVAARSALSSRATVAREAGYAMARVRAAPQNESPWNYLRALHTLPAAHARLPADRLRAFAGEFADLAAPDTEHPTAFEDRVPLRGAAWYGGVDLGPKPVWKGDGEGEEGMGEERDEGKGEAVAHTFTLPVRVKKSEGAGTAEEAKGETNEGGEKAEDAKQDEKKPMPVRSSHALDILAMLLEKEEPEMAARALDLLASRYDPIRANYWNWRKSAIVMPAKGKKPAA